MGRSYISVTTRPMCPHKVSHCCCFWGPHKVASLRESKPAPVDLCFGDLWWKSPELMANQESPASTNTKAKGEAKPGSSLQHHTAQGWNSGMHGTQPHGCIATSVIAQSSLTEMNTEPLLQAHQPRAKSKSRPFLGNECHGFWPFPKHRCPDGSALRLPRPVRRLHSHNP